MRPDSRKYLQLYKTSTEKKKVACQVVVSAPANQSLALLFFLSRFTIFQQASRGEASIRAAVAEITASQPTAASAGRSAAPSRDVLRARHRLQLFV